MNSEKVKEIKELLRCMNGEKACTNCYINDIAQEQETCCINVVADMTLDLINELESELEKEQINNLNCDTELQYKEKRIAELEKENAKLLDSVETVQSNRCTTNCELTKKQLKQFAESLKIESVNKIHETLKEFIGE